MIEKHGGDAATTELIRRMKQMELARADRDREEANRADRLKDLPDDLPPGETRLLD